MSDSKLTVVISQGQSKNPKQRQLEEEIALQLLLTRNVEVSLVPHLYDMDKDHTGLIFLRNIPGDIVVLSWLYPRGARWILDRQGIKGEAGETLLVHDTDEEDEEPAEHTDAIGSVDIPQRKIYVIDLRVESTAAPYLEEIQRIQGELTARHEPLGASDGQTHTARHEPSGASDRQTHTAPHEPSGAREGQTHTDLLSWITGQPNADQLKRYLATPTPEGQAFIPSPQDEETPKRRWYPVIDYSRCTNCMECIDFCLFGVYGVDNLDRILVEAQDNCKKGCPACSRVCPENAIIFPQHKTPAIAGAPGEVAGLKIDLSQLFGGGAKDALEMAVAERDAELIKDGRSAVGMEIGVPKRQANKPQTRDELDDLMDNLDALEL